MPRPGRLLDLDGPAVRLHDALAEAQAQAVAAGLPRARAVDPEERLEEPGQVLVRDAGAVVLDPHPDHRASRAATETAHRSAVAGGST